MRGSDSIECRTYVCLSNIISGCLNWEWRQGKNVDNAEKFIVRYWRRKMQQQISNNVCSWLNSVFTWTRTKKMSFLHRERIEEFSYFSMIFMMENKCMLPKSYSTIENFNVWVKKSHIFNADAAVFSPKWFNLFVFALAFMLFCHRFAGCICFRIYFYELRFR